MAFPRFYYDLDDEHLKPSDRLLVQGAVAHHAINVLRILAGDRIVLFNGKGGEYTAAVESVDNRHCLAVKIEAWNEVERESPLSIVLIQAASVADKMDYVVQKTIEAGVSAIRPIVTQRGVVRLSAEKASRRLEHWNSLAIAACEQCGRNRVPAIHPVISMSQWLAQLPTTPQSLRLLLTPQAATKFGDLDKPLGQIELLVGPEGGFNPDEQNAAVACGFVPLTLGPRILRTETAALVAIAALQGRWGDY